MHTISRAETRSISIAAPPSMVHEYVADARNLPEWAPAFAETVRSAGEHWTVVRGDAEFNIAVVADRDSGTVDIVAADDHTRGAFARVLPNGDGSEFLFTLLFSPDTPEHAIDAQIATVDTELTAIRAALTT